MNKNEIYESVTNRIVSALEAGLVSGTWSRPWCGAATGVQPVNAENGNAYRGMNILILWAEAQNRGYESAQWGTFNTWKRVGCSVRKGEKATHIVYWQIVKKTEKDSAGNDKERSFPILKTFCVFNRAQVDGTLPEEVLPPKQERIDNAELFFRKLPGVVESHPNRACYIPALDKIQMPTFEQFREPEMYYSTLAHEFTHWTGHKSRCDRDLSGSFGSASYAYEELVAELGASFLCARLGLESEPREDHSQYIKGWIKALKDDHSLIFKASTLASHAADYLLESAGLKVRKDPESECEKTRHSIK